MRLSSRETSRNIYSSNNKTIRIQEELNKLYIEGNSNAVTLEKSIKDIMVKGNNNRITVNSINCVKIEVKKLTIDGHSNNVEKISCGDININGTNNVLTLKAYVNLFMAEGNNKVNSTFQKVKKDKARARKTMLPTTHPRFTVAASPSMKLLKGDEDDIILSDLSEGEVILSDQNSIQEEFKRPASPICDFGGRMMFQHRLCCFPFNDSLSEGENRNKDVINYKYIEGEVTESCSICFEDFKNKEMIGSVPCSHKFHKFCLDKWLKVNNICPLCRTSLSDEQDDSFRVFEVINRFDDDF